jgi:hypothetical protein
MPLDNARGSPEGLIRSEREGAAALRGRPRDQRCSGACHDLLTDGQTSQAHHGPGSAGGDEAVGSLQRALSWLVVFAVGLAPMLVYWVAGNRASLPAQISGPCDWWRAGPSGGGGGNRPARSSPADMILSLSLGPRSEATTGQRGVQQFS